MALSAGNACLSISSGNHRTSSTNEQALSFPVFLKYKSFPYLEEFSTLHSCLNKKHVVKRDFPKGKLRRLSKYNHSLAAIASEGESSQSTKDKDGQIETINFENVSKKFLVDEVLALKEALVAAENRAAAAERGRLEAAEALAVAEAKQQEYASSVLQNRDAAIAKAQAGNKALRSDLDKLIGEKSIAERNLSQANEDAIELALKAEKIAETALQQAMTYIEVDARLRIAEAETSAAEAALKVEERIRELSDNAAETVVAEAKQVLEGARNAADMIKEQARNVAATLQERLASLDNQVNDAAQVLSLQESVSSLERKLQLANTEIEKLNSALKLAEMRLNHANELVVKAEMKLVEFQKAAESTSQVHQENSKNALESLRTAALAREEAASSAFMNEVQALQDAFQAVQKAENVKEQATLQILEALKRSLAAAEASAAAWKKRAFTVQELLQKVIRGEAISDGVFPKEIPGGGRMMTVLGSDSKKWELLADGPRREIPDWMKRRIEVLQGLPPRLPKSSLTDDAVTLALQLPSSNEVWSIAKAKIKDDVFTKKAAEDEALAKQKRALEDALQMKTKRQTALEEAASGTGTGREIVFQGFNWESWRKRWYLELAPKAADLSKCGITTVWFPPPTESVAPQGYMPQDLYNLNSAYGTKEELKSCVAEMHKHDLLVLGDVVLNHRCASKQSPNGVYNVFGGKMAWGPEAIVRDDPNFQGRGNPSNGDIFHAAPNIDHSQDFVRRDIKEWLKWLRVEIGYDGWRLDFVRGFWGGYVKEYIEETKPAFAIGEYWDSLAYESGNICYNQDAHRQRIINWINATGGTSSAFDVTTKGILHSALHNEYWRLIDPRGKPPGVMGWWPSRAVTFLENHDTGSTQGHWPFPREKLMQGYAYILTHPGTPVIFYDHFYDFGLHDPISELIAARKRTGVHCRSPVKILHATGDGYVAQIGDNLVLKLGRLDWNPSKQHNLIGSWERSIDKGGDYQIWEKS